MSLEKDFNGQRWLTIEENSKLAKRGGYEDISVAILHAVNNLAIAGADITISGTPVVSISENAVKQGSYKVKAKTQSQAGTADVKFLSSSKLDIGAVQLILRCASMQLWDNNTPVIAVTITHVDGPTPIRTETATLSKYSLDGFTDNLYYAKCNFERFYNGDTLTINEA